MGSPRARMLRLLSLLQTGRRWSAPDLADATGSPPRTLRRDIEYLRELGYPVRSSRGPGGHYRLAAGGALPPLMLEDDEAIATVLGLRLAAAGDAGVDLTAEAAERAGDKLRRVLPPRLRRATDDLVAAVEFGAARHPLPAPALLSAITGAIAARRSLAFTYRGAKGTTEREVEPVRLLGLRRRWYLLAWDPTRQDWRTFRLDRLAGDPVVGAVFAPRPLPADDLQAYLRDHFRGVPAHTIVVTLDAGVEEAASRLHRIDGVLEPLPDGRCRYTAHVDSHEWLTLVLVLLDVEFTVDGPDDFRDHLAARARRLLRATGPDR